MPNWTNRPTEQHRHPHIQLLRTPPAKILVGIVLSHDLIGCETHFYRNRTTPCAAPNCPACDSQYPTRWHAWLAAWNQKHNAIYIFEMTAAVSEPFVDYHNHYGTLHGAMFKAWRPSRTPNGRVNVEISPADLAGITLPPAPDLPSQLSHIWSIPNHDIQQSRLPGGNGELRTVLKDVLRTQNPTLRHQTRQNMP